jgi:hypothetical protein
MYVRASFGVNREKLRKEMALLGYDSNGDSGNDCDCASDSNSDCDSGSDSDCCNDMKTARTCSRLSSLALMLSGVAFAYAAFSSRNDM